VLSPALRSAIREICRNNDLQLDGGRLLAHVHSRRRGGGGGRSPRARVRADQQNGQRGRQPAPVKRICVCAG
jgi:hypothetical protein